MKTIISLVISSVLLINTTFAATTAELNQYKKAINKVVKVLKKKQSIQATKKFFLSLEEELQRISDSDELNAEATAEYKDFIAAYTENLDEITPAELGSLLETFQQENEQAFVPFAIAIPAALIFLLIGFILKNIDEGNDNQELSYN